MLRAARLEGGAWRPLGDVVASKDLFVNWADTPALAEGGDGALYAAWLLETGEHAYGAKVSRSLDQGKTWSELGWLHADRAGAEHGFVSMVKDEKGVRAFWLDGATAEKEGGSTTLRAARVGAEVRDEREIDARVCDCCSTGAAIGPRGPLLVYRDRTGDELRDISIARASGSEWQVGAMSGDGWKLLGCPVNGPEIAADGSAAAIAWFTAAANDARVAVAFSKDGGATFGKPVRLDGGKPLGRVGLVLDGQDAVVSWLEHAGESAEIRLRRIAPSGRLGAPVTLATVPATRASGVPRMLRDGTRLVVSWTQPGEGKNTTLRTGTLPLAAVPR